jgi:hypothetical protein
VLLTHVRVSEMCSKQGPYAVLGTAEIPEGNKAGKRVRRRVFREPAVGR